MSLSNAFISGMCACFASMFGKLSGLEFMGIDAKLRYPAKIICFFLMIFLNSLVWVFFVKALHSSKASVQATAISSATNYILSGIIGYLIFQEALGLLWCTGISFIILGIIIMSKPLP